MMVLSDVRSQPEASFARGAFIEKDKDVFDTHPFLPSKIFLRSYTGSIA
jgi:hypothetical protein